MVVVGTLQKRAGSHAEILPLVELCKAGKLFEVQEWIAVDKPVNPPQFSGKGQRKKSPLEYAIDLGFHSLVKVLLDGGAFVDTDGAYCPMNQALENRRFDIVQLLVDSGFDPASVDMHEVFASWDPEIMEYFIDRGADVETDNPLAWAFCTRIRTALRILKKYRDRFPSFQQQVDVALRHHCKEGNMKWVSLMLWAGADPHSPGPDDPDQALDLDYAGLTALTCAAIHGHWEVFSQRKIRIDPSQPGWRDVVDCLGSGEGVPILRQLLDGGFDPNDQENGGCSTIQSFLTRLDWPARFGRWSYLHQERRCDDHRSRDTIKAIHLLAKHGGRWLPEERRHINSARQSLLKMTPDYTVEFVWVMAKYKATYREHVEALLRTPKMKQHTAKFRARLAELMRNWRAVMLRRIRRRRTTRRPKQGERTGRRDCDATPCGADSRRSRCYGNVNDGGQCDRCKQSWPPLQDVLRWRATRRSRSRNHSGAQDGRTSENRATGSR